jgi:RNA polymerase sigma-70 factor (ECF subfamily)
MSSPVLKTRTRAAAQPPEALCREWYTAYGTALYSYLRFRLPSAAQAEDLTADVFLRAVRAVATFDPGRGSARAWLFRIARNALRDHLRHERRHPHVSLGVLDDLRSEAPSPEERLLWKEEVARLLAATSSLTAGDQELIGLRYGSGLDTAEVAEILGLREAAVRTRLWRALGRLRRVLGP